MSENTQKAQKPNNQLMFRIAVLVLVVVAAIAVIYLKDSNAVATEDGHDHGQATQPTDIDKKRPVFLDLGADKCVACKAMVPVLAELSDRFGDRLEVQFIDVWKNGEAARKHGIGLIPTQIWFDENGKELRRHEGFISVEDTLVAWKELGYDFTTTD